MRKFDRRAVTSEVIPKKPPVAYSANYTRYAVGVLTVVYIFNFTDRQILSILMTPIKQEMLLTDTQLGFLSGIAFAIFYATLGIPIARLADRNSRVNIISVCLAIWSLMTALSGLAANFWQLLAARIGVGVGEAGGLPPSHALIADYVPVERRATALGIFTLGVPIGLMMGYLLGGWIAQHYGWRAAFFTVGIPGLLLAVLLRLTVDEPLRGHSQRDGQAVDIQPSVKQVLKYLWRLVTYRHIAAAAALQGFAGYGIIQWMPSFLHRSHHLTSSEIGFWLAMVIGIGGAIGTVAGGWLADRLGRRDMRWQMWLAAIGAFAGAPFAFGIYLSDSVVIALASLFIPVIFVNSYLPTIFSVTQTLAPVRMRAMASAIMLFILNIIGLGMGPQVMGILSDLLRPAFGEQSLRYAMLIGSITYLWAALHFYMASRTLRQDLARPFTM